MGMPVKPEQIRWSSYLSYEGPFFIGVRSFATPPNPTDSDKWLAVLTATEGGHYDAINMYDRCIISVGVIQWCEAGQYSVSDMLGHVADKCGIDKVLTPLKPSLDAAGATFKKNAKGRWRFHFLDARGECDTLDKQRQLFLGCNGLKGSWTPEAKAKAKQWAADMCNVWQDDGACYAQVEFTRARLLWFVTADAKKVMWDDPKAPNEGWVGAMRAAYISYAGNIPLTASNMLKEAVAKLKSPRWSPEWCIGVLKQLTFGPNIAIYPHRYNAIRPVLESFYGVSLPKTAKDLAAWQEPEPTPAPTPEPVPDAPPPAPEPVPAPPSDPPPSPEPEPQPKPPTPPEPAPEPPPSPGPIVPAPPPGPKGILGIILYFLQMIFSLMSKRK